MAKKRSDLGLKLDDAFRDLGRYQGKDAAELQAARKADLKDRIIREGKFTESLKTWTSGRKQLLYDGYTRYEIWMDGDLPAGIRQPRVDNKKFANRAAVELEIVEIALQDHRNLRLEDLKALLPRLIKGGHSTETITRLTGFSRQTVDRASAYEQALADLPRRMQQEIASPEVNIPKQKLVGMSQRKTALAIANCLDGRKWDDDGQDEVIKNGQLPESGQVVANGTKALLKVLYPQCLEHNALMSRAIHPKGAPVKGGYPADRIGKALAQLVNLTEGWRPDKTCEECKGGGCNACAGRGWTLLKHAKR